MIQKEKSGLVSNEQRKEIKEEKFSRSVWKMREKVQREK